MQEFVHAQNLGRYIDLLEFETDPHKRAQLQKLLIEEEDSFGSLSQRLDQVERLMARGAARRRQQQAIVERLNGDGGDAGRAKSLLANMDGILQVMALYRQTLLDHIELRGV